MKRIDTTKLLAAKNYTSNNSHSAYYFTVSICKSMAFAMELPVSKLNSPKSWYNENVDDIVKSLLSKINETAHIDIKHAIDVVYNIWRTRYAMVHEPNIIPVDILLKIFPAVRVPSGSIDAISQMDATASKTIDNLLEGFIEEKTTNE